MASYDALDDAKRIVATTRRLAAADDRTMGEIASEARISSSAINAWRHRMKRSPSLAGVLAVLNVLGWTLVLKRIKPPAGEPIDLPALHLRSLSD